MTKIARSAFGLLTRLAEVCLNAPRAADEKFPKTHSVPPCSHQRLNASGTMKRVKEAVNTGLT